MSTYKCPECGNPINVNERHCANCDYNVTDAEYSALVPSKPSTPQSATPAPEIDSIMAHGNVDASTHHSEDKSTHNVDNSQTINNTNQTVTNTFIFMGGGAASMPQNIDPQTAEALKQVQAKQASQQPTQPIHTAPNQMMNNGEGQKGIGAIDGHRSTPPKTSKKWWIAVVVVAIVAVVVVKMIPNKEQQPPTQSPTTAVTSKKTATNKGNNTTTATKVSTKPATQKAVAETVVATTKTNAQATANPAPAKVVDKNYESGMKAYKEGNGLAAIQAFKASGSKESLRMIGKIYEEGCGGVEANAMMARKYYKEAENK